MSGALNAEFVQTARGRLFVVVHGDASRARRRVLVVPAFGDEMNKSRHLVTEVARRLAGASVATIVPDLHGTGDSDGEFEEASWDAWIDDLSEVTQAVLPPATTVDAVLAIRSGALLAFAARARHAWPLRRIVLWQPVVDGSRFLLQLLRMRVAAAMGSESKVTAADLRTRLLAGEPLEVGGYRIPAAIAGGLDAARLPPGLGGAEADVHWIEVGANLLPPGSATFIARARASGISVHDYSLPGEPFWGAAELVRLPGLVGVTTAAMEAA